MPACAKAAAAAPARGELQALLFKRHPGQEQVDLNVKIEVPGSWFSAGELGGLTSAERKMKYVALAVQYEERHVFPASGSRQGSKAGFELDF